MFIKKLGYRNTEENPAENRTKRTVGKKKLRRYLRRSNRKQRMANTKQR